MTLPFPFVRQEKEKKRQLVMTVGEGRPGRRKGKGRAHKKKEKKEKDRNKGRSISVGEFGREKKRKGENYFSTPRRGRRGKKADLVFSALSRRCRKARGIRKRGKKGEVADNLLLKKEREKRWEPILTPLALHREGGEEGKRRRFPSSDVIRERGGDPFSLRGRKGKRKERGEPPSLLPRKRKEVSF